MSNEGKQSPGRIFVFLLVLALFFGTVASIVAWFIDTLYTVPEETENALGRPNVFTSLYKVTSTVVRWIRDIFVNYYGFAVLIVISLIYMIITERE